MILYYIYISCSRISNPHRSLRGRLRVCPMSRGAVGRWKACELRPQNLADCRRSCASLNKLYRSKGQSPRQLIGIQTRIHSIQGLTICIQHGNSRMHQQALVSKDARRPVHKRPQLQPRRPLNFPHPNMVNSWQNPTDY